MINLFRFAGFLASSACAFSLTGEHPVNTRVWLGLVAGMGTLIVYVLDREEA